MAARFGKYADRAKQFSSFDTLRGFREALAEKERVRVCKMELSDDQKELLDRKFMHIKPNDVITVVYFHDGEYIKITGMVSRINFYEKTITIVKTKINFLDIYDVEIDCL